MGFKNDGQYDIYGLQSPFTKIYIWNIINNMELFLIIGVCLYLLNVIVFVKYARI